MLTLLSPIVVSLLTQAAKYVMPVLLKIPNAVLVLIVAILSYAAAIGQAAISGQPVDAVSITTLGSALVTFIAAHGLYFLAGKINITVPPPGMTATTSPVN